MRRPRSFHAARRLGPRSTRSRNSGLLNHGSNPWNCSRNGVCPRMWHRENPANSSGSLPSQRAAEGAGPEAGFGGGEALPLTDPFHPLPENKVPRASARTAAAAAHEAAPVS